MNIEFCGKPLGTGHPAFIVAEVGFNHNGDVDLARRMIRAAHENGADAVKLQTFHGGALYSKNFIAPDPDHPDHHIPFYEFFRRYELTPEQYRDLFEYAGRLEIPLFSTPFDEASLDMLMHYGMPAVKIASGDLTHHELLRHAARTGRPVVLSSGMASVEEIETALNTIRSAGNDQVILLHCVSQYPARREDLHLACLPMLRDRLKVPVGFSDHTMDLLPATVACALGAVMVEKHFTLDRSLPGADQAISIEPRELRRLKHAALEVTRILGDGEKKARPGELDTRAGARRSVVARCDIAAGTIITREMLDVKRPGTGIPAEDLEAVVGRTAKCPIPAEEILTWEMF